MMNSPSYVVCVTKVKNKHLFNELLLTIVFIGFLNSYKLQAHMKTHCKEFLCSECGKAFQNKANLSQHMIRHTGDKPFACKECPSQFVTKGERFGDSRFLN